MKLPLTHKAIMLLLIIITGAAICNAQPSKLIYTSPNDPLVNCTIGKNYSGADIIATTAEITGYDVDLIS